MHQTVVSNLGSAILACDAVDSVPADPVTRTDLEP